MARAALRRSECEQRASVVEGQRQAIEAAHCLAEFRLRPDFVSERRRDETASLRRERRQPRVLGIALEPCDQRYGLLGATKPDESFDGVRNERWDGEPRVCPWRPTLQVGREKAGHGGLQKTGGGLEVPGRQLDEAAYCASLDRSTFKTSRIRDAYRAIRVAAGVREVAQARLGESPGRETPRFTELVPLVGAGREQFVGELLPPKHITRATLRITQHRDDPVLPPDPGGTGLIQERIEHADPCVRITRG